MDNTIFLTKEGFEELKQRLDYLKRIVRVEVSHEIETARNFGDISENSEYDAAREKESQVEQEIFQIENTLRSAQLIKAKTDNTKVVVGSTVVVEDLEFNEELTLKIMGTFEANPAMGNISNVSPMGKALLGAKKGDIVTVETPNHVTKLKIKNIKV